MSSVVKNTVPARAAHMKKAAVRAVDDPVTLARAARIVRAALERGALTHTDLQGDVVKPSDLDRIGELSGGATDAA